MFRPTLFGKYLLTHRLAVGGMAEIFRAKVYGVGGFEKDLVVKQILPQYATYREFVNMFIDEAKITVSLNHGNIVPVYELGRIEGVYFIAMEYVHGRDLGQMLMAARESNSPMSPEQAVAVIIDVLKGLDYAHRRKDRQGRSMGIIHRDVSPQNIVVSFDGEVKLLDFGIAKAAQKLSQTHPGTVRGKFGYISPEMAHGDPVDRRTDIFSAAVVLWEALTTKRLFSGGNEADVLRSVEAAVVPPPSMIRPSLPEALDPILKKALAKDPANRYKDAASFQLALSKFLYSSRGAVTSESIGDYMKSLFAQQISREEQAEQDPARVEEIQRLYDELAIRTRQQGTDPGRPTPRQSRRRRQGTRPGIGADEHDGQRTPTRPMADRASGGQATGGTGSRGRPFREPTPSPVMVAGELDGVDGRSQGIFTSEPSRGPHTAPLDPNLDLDAMLAELGPAPRGTPAAGLGDPGEDGEDAGAEAGSLEYEVFAARGASEASIFEEPFRGRPIGWIAVVVMVLAFAGYLLYTQTNLFRAPDGSGSGSKRPARHSGSVAIRVHPEQVRLKDGSQAVAQLFWHQGDSPTELRDLPLDNEVELLVELSGYLPKRVIVPRSAWIKVPGTKGTSNTHERRIRLTLRPGSGSTDNQEIKPPSPEEASEPPPINCTGRILLDTDPAGASVWLMVGARFEGEGLDPRKLHRFMAHLPERGRRVLTLRPFLSPDNPGDWRLAPAGQAVQHRGEISFDEEP